MNTTSRTLPQLLLQHAQHRPNATAMREKKFGIWQSYTWADMSKQVLSFASALSQVGVRRGDHVVVVGSNRPRLYASMLAVQALGAIPVPLYQDAVAQEMLFPIRNAEVEFAIVEDQEQVDKLLEVRAEYPELQAIWYDDPRGLRNLGDPQVQALDTLLKKGSDRLDVDRAFLVSEIEKGRPSDVAAMFFTSGTTGNPKGVLHTHASLLDRSMAGARFDQVTPQEEMLAYLPPAWVGQNIFSFAMWLGVGYVVNCPESAETVSIDLKEIGPSYYFAPPRVFEALLTSVMIRMEDASAIKRKIFHSCMRLAKRVGPQILSGANVSYSDRVRYAIGNLLMYGPLRNSLGFSRVRVAYTAGEAIGPDLFEFFRSIGINLKQLYGSTETAVFICLQPDSQARPDTVGVPIEGVELKISETGEVLVRTAGLFKGYYKNSAATKEVLDQNGWYHTGDAGFIDANGHLKIIDRAKDVGRLAGGSIFAPKYVENKLKFFPFIKESVVFGDKRDKVSAFINIDFNAVGYWAERRYLPYAGFTDLAGRREVYDLIRECVEQVNADLAKDVSLTECQVSRFLILHKELDADDGELTRTNKIRRGPIAEKYGVLIDALYSSLSEQYIETQVKFEDGRQGVVSATLQISNARVFPTPKRLET